MPRVVFTDPQAAAVGRERGALQRDRALAEIAKTATYTRAYAESNGFLTLLSDGERLTGAYALGPEAGEWLQQATLAIRARVPLDGAARHDPAVPHVLGDLRRRTAARSAPQIAGRRQRAGSGRDERRAAARAARRSS